MAGGRWGWTVNVTLYIPEKDEEVFRAAQALAPLYGYTSASHLVMCLLREKLASWSDDLGGAASPRLVVASAVCARLAAEAKKSD